MGWGYTTTLETGIKTARFIDNRSSLPWSLAYKYIIINKKLILIYIKLKKKTAKVLFVVDNVRHNY